MTARWLLGLGAAVIVLQFLYILFLYGSGESRDRTTATTPVRCEACGETFPSERHAIEHAKADHLAPDDDTARYILTECPSD